MDERTEIRLEDIQLDNTSVIEEENNIILKDNLDLDNFLQIISPFVNDCNNFFEKDYKMNIETYPGSTPNVKVIILCKNHDVIT